MASNKLDEQQVQVNFEIHPPIDDDLEGATTLLKQTLLNFVDCSALARYLIKQKDLTQVVAIEEPDEESTSDDGQPDNDIYGLSSVIELPTSESSSNQLELDARKHLLKFLEDKCAEIKEYFKSNDVPIKVGHIINERYINLPPELALPQLKALTKFLDEERYSHLTFISKILLRAKQDDTKLPNKKSKTGSSSTQAEPIIFINPEEEIVFEGAKFHVDIDVSSQCDENASWATSSDTRYIPHRRIMLVDLESWSNIMKNLAKELKDV